MSRTLKTAAGLAFAGAMLASPMALAQLDFTGIGYVQYGDGLSFSLPIANIQVGDAPNNPGSTFFMPGQPGQVQDFVVNAIGTSGTNVVENFDGMDNAYATPSGVSGSTFFRTETGTYQGTIGIVPNNGANTWDSTLAALQTFLGNNNSLTFFFRNNQTNNLGEAAQSLAAWAQLSITDSGGNLIDIDPDTAGVQNFLDFTNHNSPYNLVSQGGGGVFLGDPNNYTSTGAGPIAGTAAATDYVLSGGNICIDTDVPPGSSPIPVPCGDPSADEDIDHNLGDNQAAYAILFPELNATLANLFASLTPAQLAGYTFHLDVRLGCDPSLDNTAVVCTGQDADPFSFGRNLTNGDELLYIAAANFNPPTIQTPEPGTAALLGIALLALGGVALRRKV